MADATHEFHVPTRPMTPIDALNRRAAALGSPGYAAAAAHADYNGHPVRVWWNSYRRYYIASYTWAGICYLARGTLDHCIAAALREYDRGALGASVTVALRDDDTDGAALCAAHDRLRAGSEPARDWWTWRHEAAQESVRDYCQSGALTLRFDWALLQDANDREAYEAALKAKYGRIYG